MIQIPVIYSILYGKSKIIEIYNNENIETFKSQKWHFHRSDLFIHTQAPQLFSVRNVTTWGILFFEK